jgi:hypothetical protein
MAGGVKVKVGNASFLKENASAIVEFDFTKTTWEEDEDFKAWCGDQYEKRITAMQQSFVVSFNENSKGLKIPESSDGAKYKIIIEVKDLERHQAFTGTWGQGKFSTTAYIKVLEIASNQIVCEIDVDGFGSGKDYDYADGLGKCYKGLAKQLFKLK